MSEPLAIHPYPRRFDAMAWFVPPVAIPVMLAILVAAVALYQMSGW